ncbi:MAG: 3-dehydroquinate synthase [Williamsia sp.]|nr:3-dehydroquinate synthase [Williamsia sp.]
MQFLQQSFAVSFDYKVFFTTAVFSRDNTLIADFFKELGPDISSRKLLFVIDEGVEKAHPDLLESIKDYFAVHSGPQLVDHFIIVKGGEETKNNDTQLNKILEATNKYGIDRHSYLAAIGGGAVLDMAGYAAAIAHRGVKLIRIPTTVLSQNDSGVGVKNSINHFNKKNFLGTFRPPVAVFNDDLFLHTLDDRNWRAGISEAVKVALIKDAPFFLWIQEHAAALNRRDSAAMEKLIFECARLHMEHIAGADPFESGSSRPLDFGHWSAHKMEQLTRYELLHGEAVAIGIALDTIYSFLVDYLPEADMLQVVRLLLDLGFELEHPVLAQTNSLLTGLHEFSEHLGGRLTIMLLEGIGKGIDVHDIDQEKFIQAVHMLKTLTKKEM